MMRDVPNAPEDFLAELERNKLARDRFHALSLREKQNIIAQAQSSKDIYEMRTLVDSI